MGLLLRRCSGKGLHLAISGEPRGFSRVTAGFSSYDGDAALAIIPLTVGAEAAEKTNHCLFILVLVSPKPVFMFTWANALDERVFFYFNYRFHL